MSEQEVDKRTYRDFLAAELEKRKSRNSTYSLRGFARWLRISPSMLSQILSGERKITLRAALKIVDRLPLSEGDRRLFLSSVEGRDVSAYESSLNSDFAEVPVEEFQPISDPIYLDILALGGVADGRWDADWIAHRLGVSRKKVSAAMQRLLRLNMVDFHEGRFKAASTPIRVRSPIPATAIQSYHRKSLQKAMTSLARDPVSDREFNLITMAIDSSKLASARELTNRYLENIHSLLDDSSEKDRIYHIAVQIFPGCTGIT